MYVYHMAGANMYVATSQMQQQLHYSYIANITHTFRLTTLPVHDFLTILYCTYEI